MSGGLRDHELADIRLADVVEAFGRLLHAAGVPVTPASSGRLATAVVAAAPGTLDELYWLGRVTLLTDVGQVETYEAVFGQVFRGWADWADSRGDTNVVVPSPRDRRTPTTADAPSGRSPSPTAAATGGDEPAADDAHHEALLGAVSDEERLGAKDFSALTPEELDRVRQLVATLRVAPPLRRSRRRSRHRTGDELDVRAMLRAAGRSGGDPVASVLRRRRTRPRRLVLIADVSGSMESYSRAYLHLLHSAVRGAHAEAFVFSTRLTRLTRPLATHDPDLALTKAAAAAPDWSGGTRIGAALKTFTDDYGRRGLARGAVVVVVSDGWEHGDPKVLAEQLDRLSRLAARIVWVNPRKASTRFEPLTGGMAAALPYVDAFVSGHSVDALDEVIAAIRGDVDTARLRRPA